MTEGKTAQKRAEALNKAIDESEARRKKNNPEPKPNVNSKTLTPARKLAVEAKVALEAETKAIVKACMEEVLEVCKKHNCRLHARPLFGQAAGMQDGYLTTAEALISILPPKLEEQEVTE